MPFANPKPNPGNITGTLGKLKLSGCLMGTIDTLLTVGCGIVGSVGSAGLGRYSGFGSYCWEDCINFNSLFILVNKE